MMGAETMGVETVSPKMAVATMEAEMPAATPLKRLSTTQLAILG
jgi:hypothetical protein